MGGSLEELAKRFRDLEVSQAKLRDQLQYLVLCEGRRQQLAHIGHDHGHGMSSRRGGGELGGRIPGHFAHGPYGSVLKHIGHALHIYRPDTGEIIFWNQSAENLYGWKHHEALGKIVGDLLMHEKSNPHLGRVTKQLRNGHSWSGQLSLKKRSGEMLMAMVTKTSLYEDGAFIGVITVSSDAAVLLDDNYKVHSLPRACKRVQWCQRPPQIIPPALKVFSRSRSCSDGEHETSQEGSAKQKNEVPALETVFIMQARKRGIVEKSCCMGLF